MVMRNLSLKGLKNLYEDTHAAMEVRNVGHLSVSIVSSGQRYAPDERLPEDLRLIGVYAPMQKKRIRRNLGYE
jgi:hypothetical protein